MKNSNASLNHWGAKSKIFVLAVSALFLLQSLEPVNLFAQKSETPTAQAQIEEQDAAGVATEEADAVVTGEADVATSKEADGEQEEDGEGTWAGLSTSAKVGISAGAVAVIGLGIGLAAGGGSGGDGEVRLTAEQVQGVWNAEGKRFDGTSSYTGQYNFYTLGRHSYDLYTSSGEHKVGGGTWRFDVESQQLVMYNDTGSTYVGTVTGGNTATMKTTDGRWTTVITR
ncbi:hypothetical protein [Desulforhopalus singaporensis]|uniref:Uncharacterized protein n=1 Tax=Desulforhopalus singaporensis TaxID=91360 RepID=A0A1H0K084_9BACT|nr:hypothetical protein [Desulforhopalus singaporensis]SDO49091.1 hypothetical protein SAMN05660330_00385 [Desulforhopalus singaporensis]